MAFAGAIRLLTAGTSLALRRRAPRRTWVVSRGDVGVPSASRAAVRQHSPRDFFRDSVQIAAALLVLSAILLPVRPLALWLGAGDTDLVAQLVAGLWLSKAMLCVHATLLLVAARVPLSSAPSAPLLALPRPEGRATRAERIVLWAIVALAAALRIRDLNSGLWYDEITTLVNHVRLPLSTMLSVYESQNQHQLYSLLAHGSITLFGDSAWALRLPAVLLGVASLPALYWFATMITTKREALLATALLAVSYHHVWFSQNARGYTGLLLGTIVASGLFLRLLELRTPRGWALPAAYAAVMAAAVYTHASAVFVGIAHGVVWLALLLRSRQGARGAAPWMPGAALVLSATLSLLLYSVVVPQFVETLLTPKMGGVSTDWKDPLWFLAESARGLVRGLPGGGIAVAGMLLVGTAGLTSWWRRSPAVTLLMVLPGIVTAAAVVAASHNLWPRFFFFAAAFAVLIAVRGVFALADVAYPARPRLLATAALVLLAVGSALTVPRAWRPKQDFAGARRFIEQVRAPGDAVVMVDLVRFPYERYLDAGWLAADSEAELEAIERGHRRTFVVYIFPTRLSAIRPDVWERIRRFYTEAAEFPGTLGGGEITVVVRG